MKRIKIKKKYIISLLLIITVFSNSFLLAKYSSSISSSSGSKKVAKWTVSYVDSENSSKNLNLVLGDENNFSETYVPPTYVLKLISTSEVSTGYIISLSNVPDAMQVKIDDGIFQSPVNNIIVFENENYKINASDNDKEKTHALTFYVPLNSSIDSVNNINIDIKFEQLD